MAKKSKINASEFMASPQVRIKRTEAYAEKVRLMFAQTVNNILALNKSMPSLDDGVMFSFDGESMKMQKKVEEALRQLHSAATLAIRRGIAVEWDIANDEIDKILNSVYGKKVLSSPEFNGWMNRNDSARDAFLNRSEKGMSLSDRVWKSVRQLRDEMEVAMTVAIGEGDSASSMSRKVREYLNDPDLMFRRFRYKAGEKDIIDPETGEVIGKEPVYKLKWKKRVKDEKTGKYKFIDYDRKSYETGQGVYKSSAKNAMRLTRTETNMAYRRADHSRWQGMDFVLGQHIEPSKNHKIEDICDKLQGDYPKDFQFDGFHPQCYCVCTPILMSEDEMAKVNEAFLKGETYTPKGKQITDYPQGFKDWVREKADKIVDAHDYGKDPYFVRNNYQAVDQILNPDKYEKKLTPLEIAAQRHEDRTPEKIDEITKKARFRAKSMDAAERYLDEFKDIDGFDTSALQDAYDHARWDDVRSEALKLAQAKRSIIEGGINAMNDGKDYGEVDITKLQTLIKGSDIIALRDQAKIIMDKIKLVKEFEAQVIDLIPDVHMWHKQFTMNELNAAHDAIDKGLAKISGHSLAEQKKMLEKEIQYVEDPTFLKPHTQYPTWKVVQDAYKTKLEEVIYQQKLEAITAQMSVVEIWSANHPQSKNVATLLLDYKLALANKSDIPTIQAKATLAYTEYQKRIKEQAKRDAKKIAKNGGLVSFDQDVYSQKRKDAAMWAKTTRKADENLRDKCGEVWIGATDDEKDAIYGYTSSYCNIQEPLRGLTYYGSESQKKLGEKRIPLIESIINKSYYDFDMWVQRGDTSVALKKFGLLNYDTASDAEMYALVGKTGTEGAFWSAGVAKGKGFDHKPIIFNIYVPKGSRLMYCEPFSAFGCGSGRHWDGKSPQGSFGDESEILIQRGTTFRVTKVEKSGGKWYIDVEIVSQNPLPFPYVNGYPYPY